jgi:hypothetical protein
MAPQKNKKTPAKTLKDATKATANRSSKNTNPPSTSSSAETNDPQPAITTNVTARYSKAKATSVQSKGSSSLREDRDESSILLAKIAQQQGTYIS